MAYGETTDTTNPRRSKNNQLGQRGSEQKRDGERRIPDRFPVRWSFLGIGVYWAWVFTQFFRTPGAPLFFLDPVVDLQVKTVASLGGVLIVFIAAFVTRQGFQPNPPAIPLFIAGAIAALGTLASTVASNIVLFVAGSLVTGLGTGYLAVNWGRLYGTVGARQAGAGIASSLMVAVALGLLIENLFEPAAIAVMAALPLISALSLNHALTTGQTPAAASRAQIETRFPYKLAVGMLACGLTFGFIMSLFLCMPGVADSAMNTVLAADAAVALIIVVMARVTKQGIDFQNAYWVVLPFMCLGFLLLPLFNDAQRLVAFFFARLGYSLFDALVWIRLSSVASAGGTDTTRVFCGLRVGLEGGVLIGNLVGIALFNLAIRHLSIVSAALVFALIVVLTIVLNRKDIDSSWGLLAHDTATPADWQHACLELAGRFRLTPREAEIMALIARGYSVARITQELCISTSTVQTHAKSIYKKLGIHAREELVRMVEHEL